MSNASAVRDETRRIVDLAIHDRVDDAVHELTEVVERDEHSFELAASESLKHALQVPLEQKRQSQTWAILVGSMSGLGWPLYLIGWYEYMGWTGPAPLCTVAVTLVGVAVGTALGWKIGR